MRSLFVALAAMSATIPLASSAQTTGVIAIGGTVVPSSCTLSVDAGGVDFGTIPLSEFNDDGGTAKPPPRATQIRANCSGPTLLSLMIRDNRRDTLTGVHYDDAGAFGIGKADSGSQLGFYRITPAAEGVVNGASAPILRSSDRSAWIESGADWTKLDVASADGYAYLSPGTGAGPAGVMSAILPLNVALTIAPLATLDLTREIVIDGSATIELLYL